MTDIAIRVENLSKQYHIGQLHQRHDTLRDALVAGLGRLRRNSQPKTHNKDDTIWALKDVSFEVKRGEVVGIIGRNGAGKSTLLKILTRITEPTSGRAELHGRVGSLLEVGTGFHPELTGRENTYLSGAILGMSRKEINRKFDEIVAFSGIEKFIDTPIKRYSSGMNVRLGFAVAAHLEPEILLIDEVLAVGDAAFQKKCLGKMEDVSKRGRTVLFVSHNMAAIQALCPRCVYLGQGRLNKDGQTQKVVKWYLESFDKAADPESIRLHDRTYVSGPKLRKVEVIGGEHSELSHPIMVGSPALFVFHINQPSAHLSCSFTIYNQLGYPLVNFDSSVHSPSDVAENSGGIRFECYVERLLFVPGRYRINVAILGDGRLKDHVEGAAYFEVVPGLLDGRPMSVDSGYGSVVMPHNWIFSN